jgi:hypothetical protein
MQAFVGCIVQGNLPVEAASQDLVLCMFVLSAIAPDRQRYYFQHYVLLFHLNLSEPTNRKAFKNIAAVLRPSGKLLIRDYGK